jgi:mannosyl-3-phosphoglycerate phosphatase family protein
MRPSARKHVVFTAMSFDLSAALPTLQRLHTLAVPVVPVTSMTLDQMEPIAQELEIRQAMIIESGGGIARWTGSGWEVEACSPDSETLLDAVREIEKRSGAALTVYSVLSDREAERLSGLSGESLHRSMRRRFSEPFIIESGEIDDVITAAASIGFSVRSGEHFLDLCRQGDQGQAFTKLRQDLCCGVAIALGDSPLDADFLGRAEIPIIVPRSDGDPDPDLLASVPHARVASAPGCAGWTAAIREVLAAHEMTM